jgi:hypothetical protein
MVPIGMNGIWTVTAANTTSVSYACGVNATATVVGTVCLNNVINNILSLDAVSGTAGTAAGLGGNFKPEWMARSISQAGIFKTNQ